MALSKKQRDFIAAYVECWHATQAAIRAGYSERSAASIGSENLKKPEISAAIEAHITAIMPKGEVVQRLAAQARGSMAPFLRRDQDGDLYGFDLSDTQPLDLIKKATVTRRKQADPEQDELITVETVTIELYDAQAALREFVKMHGLDKSGGGILKYIDYGKLSHEQLQRLADGEDILAVLLATSADPGTGGAGAA